MNFARSTILAHRPSVVYVLAGICSVTKITSHDPWTAGLRSNSINGTVSLFVSAMDRAHQEIYSISTEIGKPIMVIFPTLTGINFTAYNSYPEDLISPLQKKLDAAVIEIVI